MCLYMCVPVYTSMYIYSYECAFALLCMYMYIPVYMDKCVHYIYIYIYIYIYL